MNTYTQLYVQQLNRRKGGGVEGKGKQCPILTYKKTK